MRPRNGKSIRSVERQIAALYSESCKNHIRNLFLGSSAIACNRLFHDTRTVFAIAHATLTACHQDRASNVTKYQSAFGIFGKEDSFHTKRFRLILVQ